MKITEIITEAQLSKNSLGVRESQLDDLIAVQKTAVPTPAGKDHRGNNISEGPLDFIKKVGAAITGGTAGWNAAAADIQQNKINKMASDQAISIWNQTAAKIKQGGTLPTVDQAVQWLESFMGQKPTTVPASTNPTQVATWITTEMAKYTAAQASKQLAPPTPTPTPAPKPKPKIKTLPGETPAQAIARVRAAPPTP